MNTNSIMHTCNFTPFPVIQTERTVMRPMVLADAAEIFALRSSHEIGQYINRPLQNSVDDAVKYIERINAGVQRNEWIFWAVSLHNSPALIGTSCLWNISAEKDSAEIGYELLTPYQGKGLMHEVTLHTLKYAFEVMGVALVDAYVHHGNQKSIALLARNYFVPASNRTDPQNPNNLIYELAIDEYKKRGLV